MSGKVALIAGGSGLVGSHLVTLLLNKGYYDKIIVISRKLFQINHPKLEVINWNFDEPLALSTEVDDVYCCLGTTIKKAKSKENFEKVDCHYPLQLASLGLDHGAKHYLIVTALGANINSKVFYNQVKGKVEKGLMNLSYPSLSILQPSLLLGARNEFRFGEKVAQWFMSVFRFLFKGAFAKYKAIQGKQVALAMFYYAQEKLPGVQVYSSEKLQKVK